MKLETQLLLLQERLQDAVDVSYKAPEKENRGYPYATGYCRTAMKSVIEELGRIIDQMNNARVIDS